MSELEQMSYCEGSGLEAIRVHEWPDMCEWLCRGCLEWREVYAKRGMWCVRYHLAVPASEKARRAKLATSGQFVGRTGLILGHYENGIGEVTKAGAFASELQRLYRNVTPEPTASTHFGVTREGVRHYTQDELYLAEWVDENA